MPSNCPLSASACAEGLCHKISVGWRCAQTKIFFSATATDMFEVSTPSLPPPSVSSSATTRFTCSAVGSVRPADCKYRWSVRHASFALAAASSDDNCEKGAREKLQIQRIYCYFRSPEASLPLVAALPPVPWAKTGSYRQPPAPPSASAVETAKNPTPPLPHI
jgi:hypothetical protein